MGWTTSHQRLVGDDAHDYVDILSYRDTVSGLLQLLCAVTDSY
jgi:hypothetical protein